MNKFKSLFMTVLAVLAMVLPTTVASAQEVDTNAGGTGTITVRNASQSQKYTIYKLFDATVTEDGSGISYKVPTGKILPADNPYFAVDSKGNITAKEGATVSSEAFAAWAKNFGTEVTSATANDNSLVFTHLTFGYYFVTSSLGAVLTVDSTTPNATVIDKNTTNPIIQPFQIQIMVAVRKFLAMVLQLVKQLQKLAIPSTSKSSLMLPTTLLKIDKPSRLFLTLSKIAQQPSQLIKILSTLKWMVWISQQKFRRLLMQQAK